MLDLCKIFGVEKGEKFKIDGYEDIYFIENGYLYYIGDYGEKKSYLKSYLIINDVVGKNIIKIPKKKNFTDDELCVLKNIDKKYKWIARDKSGNLCIFDEKPNKNEEIWDNVIRSDFIELNCYNSLFNSIQWEDEEPVCIDDYVDRESEED
ncbi:MAG: hypothetical protein PUJ51_16250 [Clostridiales bacterium]|uniref:hypothetical protein n=1 Tax=Terrisporobacter sp. TaxID=1965305 RepID=UPI002A4F21A3|nr:hypothetical protein [Terrisporobacter sp.]MDD7756039.1 hypothetical protein [Clostridiales bacterium]MDY4134231.1 hypothetical protein [Terrisporobacter sp.]